MTASNALALNGLTHDASLFRLASEAALRGRSGIVRAGTVAATTSPGNSVDIAGWVVAVQGAEDGQGCYIVAVPDGNITAPAAASGGARVDVLIVRIEDDDFDGSGNFRSVTEVISGAVGGGAPSIPATSIELARWTRPADDPSIEDAQIATATGMVWPYARVLGAVESTSVLTGASDLATAVIPGLALTVTLEPHRRYRVSLEATVQKHTDGEVVLAIYRDGSLLRSRTRTMLNGKYADPRATVLVSVNEVVSAEFVAHIGTNAGTVDVLSEADHQAAVLVVEDLGPA